MSDIAELAAPFGEGPFGPPTVPLPAVATTYPTLLPPNSTKLERALAGPTGRIDNAIVYPGTPNPLSVGIDLLEQAMFCPASLLPWLAWYMSLSLWDWEWDETKRRSVIARAVELNRIKGTAQGIREYCDVMGSEAVQIVVPPQEFYIGQPLTKDQWNAWIQKMPEIRIKLIQGSGIADLDTDWYIGTAPGWSGSPPITSNDQVWKVWHLESNVWIVISEHPTQVEADDAVTGLVPAEYYMVSPGITQVPVIYPPMPIPYGIGLGVIGSSFLSPPDQGPILYGRRIIERVDGVDHPLQLVVETTTTVQDQVLNVERVYTAGTSTMGFFLGDGFLGDQLFLEGTVNEVEPSVVTLDLDSTYDNTTDTLGLTTVWPSLTPISPRYIRESDTVDAGPYCYLDDFFMGASDQQTPLSGGVATYPEAIIKINDAGNLLADVLYLLDPNVATPMMEGFSFIGVSRIGMPAYRAEVMVDLKMSDPNREMLYLNDGFIGEGIIGELDTSLIDRAIYAIRASKAVRDKIMVSFAPYRPVMPKDFLTSGMKVGDWVPNRL
jgi:phage tail P2-like protein